MLVLLKRADALRRFHCSLSWEC